MNEHSRAFEQYCFVMKKNIVIQETTFHDGRRRFVCTMSPNCVKCKNNILRLMLENEND